MRPAKRDAFRASAEGRRYPRVCFALAKQTLADKYVRGRSYAPVMTVGIVAFGLVFLVGLVLGTRTRRPLATAGIVVGAFCGLLVIQTNEPFVAFASFAMIALGGLVADSVRETVELLLGR